MASMRLRIRLPSVSRRPVDVDPLRMGDGLNPLAYLACAVGIHVRDDDMVSEQRRLLSVRDSWQRFAYVQAISVDANVCLVLLWRRCWLDSRAARRHQT